MADSRNNKASLQSQTLASGERDVRLDYFRGITLWLIFLELMPQGAMSWITLKNYGFSNATDIFIFLSGYSAAFVYSKTMKDRGFVIGSAGILRLVWQIYVAHVFLIAIYLTEISYVATRFDNPLFSEELAIFDFLGQTDQAIVQGLLLRFKPVGMEILPLYIVILVSFPPVLWLLIRWPTLALTSSVLLYVITWEFGLNLPAWPAGVWYFNPFAWQLLFVFGAWCAVGGAASFANLIKSDATLFVAVTYLTFSFLVTLTWHIPRLALFVPPWVAQLLYPIDIMNLDVLRFAHFLALAGITVRFIPQHSALPLTTTANPLVLCGQNSLPVFCLLLFLAMAARFLFAQLGGTVGALYLVSAAGLLIMSVFAVALNLQKNFQRFSDRVSLIARGMGNEANLAKLDDLASKLPEGTIGFLAQVPLLRSMLSEISTRQKRLDTIQRPAFREPYAEALLTEIENFSFRVADLKEPLASLFTAAAANWLKLANFQLQAVRSATAKMPAPQVFRAGDPVDRANEAFIPRLGFIADLEGQLTLATGCPGVVLYGRRRTGKSTALKNLSGFLPPEVEVATISMQNPEAFTSIDSFVRLISNTIAARQANRNPLVHSLSNLHKGLSEANDQLLARNKRLILAIDEYEYIDEKIGSKDFPQELLATIRDSAQFHRQITWLFAGSHEIDELSHAPWSSFLVSFRTMEMPLFTAQETYLLLTEPLQYSPLWGPNDPKRPRFSSEMWGEGGVDYIYNDSGGWPHLVQLIAETAVDLLNDSARLQADMQLLQRASERAVTRGHLVLSQLLHKESTLPGEWEYISQFRRHDTRPAPISDHIFKSLNRRMLFVDEGGMWRFRVPLMQRWLRTRG